jgi:hypothetical protein
MSVQTIDTKINELPEDMKQEAENFIDYLLYKSNIKTQKAKRDPDFLKGKISITEEFDEPLPEYDFSGGVRGKYAAKLAEENGYFKLDPKVTEYFKKSEDINKILLAIIDSSPFRTHSTTY